MIKLDLKTVRFDRMADGVQFVSRPSTGRKPKIIVEITRQALEDHFNTKLDEQAAILRAVEMQTYIQQAANRMPDDDGKIRLTAATLRGRDWE